ncbi:hypothetical protein DZF91_18995 [Actinomadura logoneensis]|uniref:BD-FAE-like domain-containing protein n=1 Tax=Actinomadura logoneensis TaxID=2293572 RepID=A0A372JJS7_9ACTN|nr:hypothetical protein [Actinomadura logoneensis]RFU40076.1 hypothetical protein DZF91_18995 [Actinomadura logoneensis]
MGRRALLGIVLATGAAWLVGCGDTNGADPLAFRDGGFKVEDASVKVGKARKNVRYRVYPGLSYVARPVDRKRQTLSVQVPVRIDGRPVDSAEAPIMVDSTGSGAASTAAHRAALAAGLVVVTTGVRDGSWNGIVDLKAAVRYLRHNQGKLPGDTDRIVAAGTGPGGGLATLLGASAGRGQYDDDLRRLGAAEATDLVYAVAASSPVTALDKADLDFDRKLVLTRYIEPSGARYLRRLPEDDRALYLKRNPWIGWMHGRVSVSFDDFVDHAGKRRAADVAVAPKGDTPLRNAMDFVRQRNPDRARHWWLRADTGGGDVPITVVGTLAAGLDGLGDDVDAAVDWDAGDDGGDTGARATALTDWITRTAARRS